MRDNLPNMLRAAAKEWRTENKVVATGATRYDDALDEAASVIEELEKLTDAQLDVIKQYQAYLDKTRWIPASERLPGREWVLCKCRANIHDVLSLRDGYWYHDPQHQYMSGFVTHWQPLPEPPKENEHEP